MKKQIGIFTILIFSVLFSILTIHAHTQNYPQTIQPLQEDSLQDLIVEFEILNSETVCNSLDKYGFVLAEVCQPDELGREDITNKNELIAMARGTIVLNSKFTGATDGSNLIVEHYTSPLGLSKNQARIDFKNQVYNGIKVENTAITVFVDAEKVYRIDGHWYPNIEVPESILSEEQAKNKLVGKELTYGDIAGKSVSYTIIEEDLTKNAEKVILPKYSTDNIELRLAWKVPIGKNEIMWYVYVDAVNGEELKTQQMFMNEGIPQRDTNQTINNTNLNISNMGNSNYVYWIVASLVIIIAVILFLTLRKKK